MGSLILPGYLYWDGFKYVTQQVSSTLTGPAGGDLSGTYPNPSVVKLNGNPVSAAVPSTGQILEWNGTTWGPGTGAFTAGGDLSGTSTSQTVIGIQGNPITQQSLNGSQTGYVLTWNGSHWLAQVNSFTGAASGDLGDSYPDPTVRGIWEAKVPQAGTGVPPGYSYSGSSFTIGNPLQIINSTVGDYALGYAPLNLNSGTNVTGLLPTSNQEPQTVGGDLSGVTSSASVVKLNGNPVQHNILSGNPAYDGYILTWSYSDEEWEAKPSVTGSTLAGDVTGAVGSNYISKLQGVSLLATGPSSGNVLIYNSISSAYVNQALSISFNGDVSGSWTSSTSTSNITLEKIMGKPLDTTLSSIGAAQDGYTLTWNNAGPYWEALPSGSSSGGVEIAGDLGNIASDPLVIGIYGNPVSSTSALGGQVLVENYPSATGSSWQYIVDHNISSSAAIAGSKINPTFTSTIIAAGTPGLNTSSFIECEYINLNYPGSPVTIISGFGAPSTNILNDGSIYLRTDGAADGYESLYAYADGGWVAIGAAAAGLAGGDLSGNYPNPTVEKIHGSLVEDLTDIGSGSDKYILTWNQEAFPAPAWQAIENAFFTTPATGDLSGFYPNPSVIAIQQNAVEHQVLGAADDGYVLTWNNANSWWKAAPVGSGTVILSGEVTGFANNTTVTGINGATAPISSIANIGNTLYYSGTNTISYGPVNLSGGGNYVSGVLPSGNQAAQNMSGDVTGTTGSSTVIKIHGNSVSAIAPTAGQFLIENSAASSSAWTTISGDVAASVSTVGDLTVVALQGNAVLSQSLSFLDDGYVLTWGASGWEALPPTSGTSFTAGGDLSGTNTNQTVIAIQGNPVSATTATAGQFLIENSSASGSSWKSLSGDVTSSTSTVGHITVTALQGNAVELQTLSSVDDGYVLTWHNASSQWQALPNASSSITLSGDVTGLSSSNTVNKINGTSVPATPTANQVLVATSGTAATWELLGNSQIASSAAIAVSKLAAGTSAQVLLNSATPTPTWTTISGDVIISSTGATTVNSIQGVAISGTPASGYVLEATSSTAASWQPAASGSFSAGGDLSGSSTSQNVIKIQGNAVQSGALGSSEDGYVLTWVNASNEWKAEPASGGNETGKIIYASKTVTSSYSIDSSENDYYIWCNQNSPINITLPVPSPGRTINIKDISNNASTNNISILQNSSENIEGVSGTFIFSTNLGSITLAADNNGNWWLV